MPNNFEKEPMMELFIFETRQMIEQLEQMILNCEETSDFESSINEIFRIMHTIKSSAAMMRLDNIANLAHSTEDLFDFLRETKPENYKDTGLFDMVLKTIDFIKEEINKIEDGKQPDGESSQLIAEIQAHLNRLHELNPSQPQSAESRIFPNDHPSYISMDKSGQSTKKNKFEALISFQKDCQMENLRAFSIIHDLKEIADDIWFIPEEIIDNCENEEIIRRDGFKVNFCTDLNYENMEIFFSHIPLASEIKLSFVHNNLTEATPHILEDSIEIDSEKHSQEATGQAINSHAGNEIEPENLNPTTKQNLVSINLSKLDLLLDLVGELVISEALVTRNPDLEGLTLDNFTKAARHLRKISNEIQDVVMTMRLVTLSPVFQKMHRLMRDMSRKLGKEVHLELSGEETEVDKSIIEHISDPLIHLIRNAMDHGIESPAERKGKGKPEKGLISLEAKNEGGDVWIIVKDDGAGLDKEHILKKARNHGLVTKDESKLSEQEIFSFIFLPGFSTKETVTEYSGRGVGMDVVKRNIEKIRGSILVDSTPGMGTKVSIRIPLTLAIISGMTICVGASKYTIPITSIIESLKVNETDILAEKEEEETVLIRGERYPVIRLHRFYKVKTDITQISQGIIMIVQNESQRYCLFADSIVGEQQVVIKPLPKYIEYVRGISGCTLLGDGSISLVLNIEALFG